jgi:hypothetical protein
MVDLEDDDQPEITLSEAKKRAKDTGLELDRIHSGFVLRQPGKIRHFSEYRDAIEQFKQGARHAR